MEKDLLKWKKKFVYVRLGNNELGYLENNMIDKVEFTVFTFGTFEEVVVTEFPFIIPLKSNFIEKVEIRVFWKEFLLQKVYSNLILEK